MSSHHALAKYITKEFPDANVLNGEREACCEDVRRNRAMINNRTSIRITQLEMMAPEGPKSYSICSLCDDIFDSVINKEVHPQMELFSRGEDLCWTLDDVFNSSQAGCWPCKFFFRSMGALPKTYPSTEIKLRHLLDAAENNPGVVTFVVRPTDRSHSYTCCNRGDTPLTFIVRFSFAFTTTLKGPSLLTWHRDVATSNTTEPSISFLETCKRWLNDCKEHESCRPLFPLARLPARLLDLQGHFPDLRLCCTDNFERKTSYMTLSHCWGSPNALEPIKLTRENYLTYLQIIHFAALPISFRDTITLVRRLGCRYLWVDALCIIQGDLEDWTTEGSRMAGVYGQSSLNIAATAGHDATTGLYAARDPTLVRGTPILRQAQNDTHHSAIGYFTTLLEDLYRENVIMTPLNTRAWVFQERYLAPRTISFGPKQVLFECSTGIACESYPYGFNRDLLLKQDEWHKGLGSLKWGVIVAFYSRKQLSFESDRLAALSGIAESYAMRNNYDISNRSLYLAGVWKPSILIDLAWFSEGESNRVGSPSIPSWSWASVFNSAGVSILNSCLGEHYRISVVKAEVNHISGLFGGVNGGYLRIRCNTLVRFAYRYFIGSGTISKPAFELHIAGQKVDSTIFEYRCINLFIDASKDVELGMGRELFLMPFRSQAVDWTESDADVMFILESEVGGTGIYRRLGLFRDRSPGAFRKLVRKAEEEPKYRARENQYEEVLGPDEYGKEQFIIRLV